MLKMKVGLSTLVSIAALVAGADMARAAPPCDGTAKPVTLVVTQHMSLGTFTRPDASAPSGTITLAADGTRSLPPTLTIQSDTLNPARAPVAAKATINGGASCRFRLSIDSATSNLFNVTFMAEPGYSFISSSANTADGDIKASTKDFKFSIGVQALVSATPSSLVPGSITIRVTYIAS